MANSPAMRSLQASSFEPAYRDDGDRAEPAEWVSRLSDASLIRRLNESAERMRQWDDGGPVQLDWIGDDAGRSEETMRQLMSEAKRRLYG
jgi:hypothetical protein